MNKMVGILFDSLGLQRRCLEEELQYFILSHSYYFDFPTLFDDSALPEDADNAIKALNGTDLKGRKLKLESAVKKLRGKNAPKENKDETDKTGDDKDDGEKKTDADEPKKKREKKAKAVKADNGTCKC